MASPDYASYAESAEWQLGFRTRIVAGPSVAETAGLLRLHPRDKSPEEETSRSTCAYARKGSHDACIAASHRPCIRGPCNVEPAREAGSIGWAGLRLRLQSDRLRRLLPYHTAIGRTCHFCQQGSSTRVGSVARKNLSSFTQRSLRRDNASLVQPRHDDHAAFRDDALCTGQSHAARSARNKDALVLKPCHCSCIAERSCDRTLERLAKTNPGAGSRPHEPAERQLQMTFPKPVSSVFSQSQSSVLRHACRELLHDHNFIPVIDGLFTILHNDRVMMLHEGVITHSQQ